MVLAEAWDWLLGLNAGVHIVHSNLRMNCRCGIGQQGRLGHAAKESLNG